MTVLERDRIDSQPALHKSIPQGNHLHGLLLAGLQVATSLYPGFIEKLEKHGAMRCRMGQDMVFYGPTGKAYSVTGTVREPRDLGAVFYSQSRGLLEYCAPPQSVWLLPLCGPRREHTPPPALVNPHGGPSPSIYHRCLNKS